MDNIRIWITVALLVLYVVCTILSIYYLIKHNNIVKRLVIVDTILGLPPQEYIRYCLKDKQEKIAYLTGELGFSWFISKRVVEDIEKMESKIDRETGNG